MKQQSPSPNPAAKRDHGIIPNILMKAEIRPLLRATRRNLRRLKHWIDGYDEVGGGAIPKSLTICTRKSCRTCGRSAAARPELRIIYLLPSTDAPIGGNKVSYREVEIISSLGVNCFAFHPEKPRARYTWFTHNVKTLPLSHFNPARDFLVFSEMWASLAAKLCVPAGLRYAIFVQNGYLAHNTAGFPREVTMEAYRNADLVLSISSDTTAMISLTYPFIPTSRILRLYYSVPPIFSPGSKQRLITYMPRKLRAHSERLCIYLKNVLGEGWRLQPIENLNERGVAELMATSSIFLSLSELEGYPIPPLEAALAGNLVVGYTGEGAREYFKAPLFREVPNGNFLLFVAEVRRAIDDVENGGLSRSDVREQRAILSSTHSAQNETASVAEFVNRVRAIMNGSLNSGALQSAAQSAARAAPPGD